MRVSRLFMYEKLPLATHPDHLQSPPESSSWDEGSTERDGCVQSGAIRYDICHCVSNELVTEHRRTDTASSVFAEARVTKRQVGARLDHRQ